MIDQNRDGFIDNEDLKDMLASLGKPPLVLSRSDLCMEPPFLTHTHRPGTQRYCGGWDDVGGPRPSQLHHVPYSLRRKANG